MADCEERQFTELKSALWQITEKERRSIVRKVLPGETPWMDSMELSGFKISIFLRYGIVSGGALDLSWIGTWIPLRTIPIETCGANFQVEMTFDEMPHFAVSGQKVTEHPQEFSFDGTLNVASTTSEGLEICRRIFASADETYALQHIRVTNRSQKPITVNTLPGASMPGGLGGRGVYVVESFLRLSRGRQTLRPGESADYTLTFSARTPNTPAPDPDGETEYLSRMSRAAALTAPMQLHTGVDVLDNTFHFAKLRAGENIFKTRAGLLHSPGGRRYYASVWCNDQLEYAAPWAGFTGDKASIEAAFNAFKLYENFMASYDNAIPSSIISEGVGFWNRQGDRGDAAMYAYGAARFALAAGDRRMAVELLRPIEWCLEFCRRKLNAAGVPESDTDEMENRLPAGDANLCTASLYYGALRAAAGLEKDCGDQELAATYSKQADILEKAIENHFGSTIRGYRTYRYYEGCEVLRSWMGIPLCMGITCRAQGVIDALFSPHLWLGAGMLSAEGDTKVWDRSALYGFRGAFAAGITELAFKYLCNYSAARLTGEHVPYAFEAWPENDCRQTSAESALYTRIFTEGWFGITPAGLRKFTVVPHPPKEVPESELLNIPAFGHRLDLYLKGRELEVLCDGETIALSKDPQGCEIKLPQ